MIFVCIPVSWKIIKPSSCETNNANKHYSSLDLAKADCADDSTCISVYDGSCKGKVLYFCKAGSMTSSNVEESCIHIKQGKTK